MIGFASRRYEFCSLVHGWTRIFIDAVRELKGFKYTGSKQFSPDRKQIITVPEYLSLIYVPLEEQSLQPLSLQAQSSTHAPPLHDSEIV